jgi:hypothetical protein
MLDSWTQDVRYAARMVRRNPIFSLTAALSLAIGIGANTTIFTIANALLFRAPVGVADRHRLVDVGRGQNGSGFDTSSYPNVFLTWYRPGRSDHVCGRPRPYSESSASRPVTRPCDEPPKSARSKRCGAIERAVI